MTRIFISYRRDDTEGEAGRLADKLIERLGAENVFFDRSTIIGGDVWLERINRALAECDVLLVVIGQKWLKLPSASGGVRLAEPGDMVAHEIASVLMRKARVIPVLVQRTVLPASAELPERVRGLLDSQASEIRPEAFDRDFAALLRAVGGEWLLPSRPIQLIAALTVLIVVGALAWWLLPREAPSMAAGAERTFGDVRLRLNFNKTLDPAIRTPDRLWMYLIEPERLPKTELENPTQKAPGTSEFAFPYIMPAEGERLEADLVREVQESALAPPVRTTVCFTRAPKVVVPRLAARLDCDEGEHCTIAQDDAGHIRACGSAPRPTSMLRSWPPDGSLVGSAHAQSAPSAGWIVPSLATLRRRHLGGNAPAYTEVTLTSPPLAALQQATLVSVGLEINGRAALIDGLPDEANAVQFDAKTGLKMQFGLENLEFSGAQRGFEQVELTLRFFDKKKLVRETTFPLHYVALRDKTAATQVGDADLGIRWTAKYVPGPVADKFQVFLLASTSVDEIERNKQRFDSARFELAVGGVRLPMIAVIRPPLEGKAQYGLAVGLRQPTGQIRFSFDEPVSELVCARLVKLAQGQGAVRRDTYRRNIDNADDSKQCAAFGSK